MLRLQCISSPSLVIAGEHGKRHAMPVHKPQAVSDSSNPHSLGTLSAFDYIESLAKRLFLKIPIKNKSLGNIKTV